MSLALRRDIVDRGLTEKWTPLAGQAPQHGAAVPHHLATAGLFPALRGLRGEKRSSGLGLCMVSVPGRALLSVNLSSLRSDGR